MKIQIFGERCTGTNYLERLVLRNLKVELTWDYGWKHFFPETDGTGTEDVIFVVIHRNAADWIRSLHLHPWHAAPVLRGISFSDFIRQQWWCIWDEHAKIYPGNPRYGVEIASERNPETGQRFANPLELRTSKIRSWRSLQARARHSYSVNYEVLYERPKSVIVEMAKTFGLHRSKVFRNVYGYKQSKLVPYIPKTYAPISRADADFILHTLDSDLERDIGYDLPVTMDRATEPNEAVGSDALARA